MRGSQGKAVTARPFSTHCNGTQKQESLQHLFARFDVMCKADTEMPHARLVVGGIQPTTCSSQEKISGFRRGFWKNHRRTPAPLGETCSLVAS